MNDISIKVRPEMLPWIQLQRGKSETANTLIKATHETFSIISPHLPIVCNNYLDIGCGLATVPLLIYNYFYEKPKMFLLDSFKKSEKIYYGYHDLTAFYNDPNMTELLLSDNGVPLEDFSLIDVDRKKINIEEKMDLITSFWSWGFHYPIEEYITEAWRLLNPEGKLILILRKGTNGDKYLSKIFKTVKQINTKYYEKAIFVVAEKS